MRERRRMVLPTTLLHYLVMIGLALLWVLPLVSALAMSVLPLSDIRRGWWNLEFGKLTVENYAKAWDAGISQYVVNSFIITILSISLMLVVGSLAAYAFARMRFHFQKTCFVLAIFTLVLPVQVVLIPLSTLFREFGLSSGSSQFIGIALVHAGFGAGWVLLMLVPSFRAVPLEIEEAATIDGAGRMRLFLNIALPLAGPGLVSFAIVQVVFVWNDLLLGLTLLDRQHQPLTVGLANLQSPVLAQTDLVAAGSIMAILPPLLLFTLLNRHYVRGMFAGTGKG